MKISDNDKIIARLEEAKKEATPLGQGNIQRVIDYFKTKGNKDGMPKRRRKKD